MIWGLFTVLQLGAGYGIYYDYDALATSLNTGKSGTYQTSNWTAAWIKTQVPLAMWFNTAYAVMGMQGLSTFGWLLSMIGAKGLFLKLFKLGMLYPLIQIGLVGYTYSLYSTCASTVAT